MGTQADRIAARLTSHVEKSAKALVLAITANLIKATPVDTGWARANWVPSIGEPVVAAVGAREAVSSAEQQAGQAQVLSYKLAGGVLYVSNNVPYIRFLNYGSSSQQPAGFVEVAIARALQQVREKFGVDFGVDAFTGEQGAAAAGGLAEAYSPFGGEA